jgi:hypothetical protein
MGKIVLGIDPGQKGGFALIEDGNPRLFPMPDSESLIARFFEVRLKPLKINTCVIERVHTMPGQGVASSGKFMRGVGFLHACLLLCHIDFVEMDPRSWQKALGIKPRIRSPQGKNKAFINFDIPESDTQWKERLRQSALAIFPGFDIPIDVADALLIAVVAERISA